MQEHACVRVCVCVCVFKTIRAPVSLPRGLIGSWAGPPRQLGTQPAQQEGLRLAAVAGQCPHVLTCRSCMLVTLHIIPQEMHAPRHRAYHILAITAQYHSVQARQGKELSVRKLYAHMCMHGLLVQTCSCACALHGSLRSEVGQHVGYAVRHQRVVTSAAMAVSATFQQGVKRCTGILGLAGRTLCST